ncbi:MAG: methyltransferase [Methylophilales bacterium]|nr:methyltransferase [Methylophilales bacterium]
MHDFPSQYELNDGISFPLSDVETGSTPFNYSDGEEFEQSIKTIISSASDRSLFSPELRQAIWDWRSSCHLSPVRANILRPLEAICRGRVLELGSGCGIITRYLGELGSDVVALEASPFRASVTRLRTEDLKNVEVVCDRIEDFNSEKKFDVVTMIGVLQYARIFSNCGDTAELSFIENAARQLATDGVLVIAIQNKLSLKSLSGYPEPNVGLPYFGIENRYGPETIIRFGLDELKAILSSVGLSHQAVLFPFPDYHMPVTILNESAVKPDSQFRAEPLISASAVRDRARPDWVPPQFSLELAWEAAQSSGATPYLSNAFLIIAGKTEQSLSFHREMKEYAWHYSVDRHPAFATQKRFVAAGDDVHISCTLVQATPKPNVPLTHHVANEEYINGRLWWELLVEIVNRPGWSVADLVAWMEPWLAALQTQSNQKTNNLNELLPGALFDYTPFNCVQALDGSLKIIDREWEVHSSLTFSHLILRGLFGSLAGVTSCASPTQDTPTVVIELIKDVLKYSDLNLTDDHIDQFIVKEARIQSWVSEGKDSQLDSNWAEYIKSVSLNCRIPNQQLVSTIAEMERQLQSAQDEMERQLQSAQDEMERQLQSAQVSTIAEMERQLQSAQDEMERQLQSAQDEMERQLQSAQDEMEHLKLSTSWRITAPFRVLGKLWYRLKSLKDNILKNH